MKKLLCTAVLVYLLCLTGCGGSGINPNLTLLLQDDVSGTAVFVSGMGCSDTGCTDPSHHHDCPPDCEVYDHHHYCDLDCAEASHHHADTHHEADPCTDPAAVTDSSFVSGMGCSDTGCTDPSHHHDCPQDCEVYDHHHYCDLDCAEASHHHSGTNGEDESGQHHAEQHHGGNHH